MCTWGNACSCTLKVLEIEKEKIVRMITKVKDNTHTKEMCKDLGILDLQQLIKSNKQVVA